MGRAPCCEKAGLKRGPWTREEDQVLVSYIQKHGHDNWRALPKQAGLLRCGKSCRLRWINYLKPDIKRGNFTREEEESIIKLHEMLGNRWSSIAAKLPGRTDNEIKNVWHTHLKKKLQNYHSKKNHHENIISEAESAKEISNSNQNLAPESPHQSSVTDASSSVTASDQETNNMDMIDTWESFPGIDESFWTEALSTEEIINSNPEQELNFGGIMDDGMEFWYDLFMRAGEEDQQLITGI